MTVACVDLFISYAPQDENHLNRLVSVLRPSVRLRQVQLLSRKDALPGEDVEGLVARQLAKAQVIVLLLSASYLADDECYREALQAITMQGKNQARVVAVRL